MRECAFYWRSVNISSEWECAFYENAVPILLEWERVRILCVRDACFVGMGVRILWECDGNTIGMRCLFRRNERVPILLGSDENSIGARCLSGLLGCDSSFAPLCVILRGRPAFQWAVTTIMLSNKTYGDVLFERYQPLVTSTTERHRPIIWTHQPQNATTLSRRVEHTVQMIHLH